MVRVLWGFRRSHAPSSRTTDWTPAPEGSVCESSRAFICRAETRARTSVPQDPASVEPPFTASAPAPALAPTPTPPRRTVTFGHYAAWTRAYTLVGWASSSIDLPVRSSRSKRIVNETWRRRGEQGRGNVPLTTCALYLNSARLGNATIKILWRPRAQR